MQAFNEPTRLLRWKDPQVRKIYELFHAIKSKLKTNGPILGKNIENISWDCNF